MKKYKKVRENNLLTRVTKGAKVGIVNNKKYIKLEGTKMGSNAVISSVSGVGTP